MEPKSAWYVKEDASEDKPCGDVAWVEFSTSASEGNVWQCVPTSPVVLGAIYSTWAERGGRSNGL